MTYRALADSTGANILAYIPSPPRGVWDIGPFPLRAYALCIIIGIVVAIWWGEKRWQERGGQAGMVLDVAMIAVPFGLIGGRLYHVATDWQTYFGPGGKSGDWWKIWQGGLGIWGAVLLGAVGAWIACRHYRVPLPAFGDAVAPGILLAQAIGRLGNYFNQELYGRETDVPWGLEIYLRFDKDGQFDAMNGVSTGVVDKIVQPTFLYEMVWNLLGVAALLYLDKKFRIGHGRLFALYVAIYCFGRFWVELLRDDTATHIAGIRINSFTAAIVFAGAIAYFVFATKGRETAEQLQEGPNRPWPWEFGKLRAYGAAAAAGTAVVADAEDTDADESISLKKDSESEDDAAEKESAPEKDAPAADEATDSTDKDSGAADTETDSDNTETGSAGNESATAGDNSSESSGSVSDAEPSASDKTKTAGTDKNES